MAIDVFSEVPTQWRESDVREVARDEAEKTLEEWCQSHPETSSDVDENEDIMDVLGSISGFLMSKFPLSFIWIFGSILVGLGTGNFLESVGWGLLTLAGGWVLLRIGIFLK